MVLFEVVMAYSWPRPFTSIHVHVGPND